MMDEQPLVSIGLPVYNGAQGIKKALDSLRAQTYRNFEIVISDNASNDDTESICREYAKRDSRVLYFRNSNNVGLIRNVDVVLSKSGGEYFMLASDDDWWYPDCIRILKNALETNPNCGVAMGSLDEIAEDGKILKRISFVGGKNVMEMNYFRKFRAIVEKKPPLHFFICGLFRMSVIKKVLSLPFPRVLGPDKVVMCEMAAVTDFCAVPDVVFRKTVHTTSDRNRQTGEYGAIINSRFAYVKHISSIVYRLASSTNISFLNKLTLPREFLYLTWQYKKHLLRELFPSVFYILKKILRRG